MTNINNTINEYITSLKTVLSANNLNGYISYDVLSSISTFRDGFSTNTRSYNLGTKYKKYNNYLGNGIGTFDHMFSNTASIPIGMDNFYSDGWTYSLVVSGSGATSSYNIINNNNKLLLSSNYSGDNNPQIILNNNNININKNSYSLIEFNLDQFYTGLTFSLNSQMQFINNPPTYSITPNAIDYPNNGQTTKQEFYFNKYGLNMVLQCYYTGSTSPALTMSFNSISFYEIDMIPFFQYTTESNVDQNIQTPLTGISPYITYAKNNIKYIY
jgi:hypothetical protein